MTLWMHLPSALAIIGATCIAAADEDVRPLQEFTLKEHFGVRHADQVVAFELQKKADPRRCYLVDDTGKEVPFQTVEGGITSVDSMTVTVREQGPVRAVVELRYDITCPALTYGALQVRSAGAAHYTTTFTLERGQPSVLIETDTDLYSTYSFSLYDGVRPTQLRYCGSKATEPKYGHLEDGSVYPVAHDRPGMDALVDLDYSQPVEVGYRTGDGTRGWMRLWDYWAINTGYYWQMYDAGGQPGGNLMGIFAGAPSRLIGAGGSGPGIYNRPGPDAGITVEPISVVETTRCFSTPRSA